MANIVEKVIIPYNSTPTDIIFLQEYDLFAPVASTEQVGLASFDKRDFSVNSKGNVSIRGGPIGTLGKRNDWIKGQNFFTDAIMIGDDNSVRKGLFFKSGTDESTGRLTGRFFGLYNDRLVFELCQYDPETGTIYHDEKETSSYVLDFPDEPTNSTEFKVLGYAPSFHGVTGKEGAPVKLPVVSKSRNSEPYTLVARDNDGRFSVVDPEPDFDTGVVNVRFAKLTYVPKIKEAYRLYGTDISGETIAREFSSEPNLYGAIAQYKDGHLSSYDPETKWHVVNKNYFEKIIADYLLKTGGTITGDLSINGNLNVKGSTTSEEIKTLTVKDAFIVTNENGEETKATLSGILMKTSATKAYAIVYEPSTDSVKLGEGTYSTDETTGETTFTFDDQEGTAIATRAQDTNWEDGDLATWDTGSKSFIPTGKKARDITTVTTNGVPQATVESNSFVKKLRVGSIYDTVVYANRDGKDTYYYLSLGGDANTVILRDSKGRATVADPINSYHAATKGYVDARSTYDFIITSADDFTQAKIDTIRTTLSTAKVLCKGFEFGGNFNTGNLQLTFENCDFTGGTLTGGYYGTIKGLRKSQDSGVQNTIILDNYSKVEDCDLTTNETYPSRLTRCKNVTNVDVYTMSHCYYIQDCRIGAGEFETIQDCHYISNSIVSIEYETSVGWTGIVFQNCSHISSCNVVGYDASGVTVYSNCSAIGTSCSPSGTDTGYGVKAIYHIPEQWNTPTYFTSGMYSSNIASADFSDFGYDETATYRVSLTVYTNKSYSGRGYDNTVAAGTNVYIWYIIAGVVKEGVMAANSSNISSAELSLSYDKLSVSIATGEISDPRNTGAELKIETIPSVGLTCLKEGTLVETDEGSISVESIKPGDKIKCWSINKNEVFYDTVAIPPIKSSGTDFVRFIWSNGTIVDVCGDDRFFDLDKNRDVVTRECVIGMRSITCDGKIVTLEKKEERETLTPFNRYHIITLNGCKNGAGIRMGHPKGETWWYLKRDEYVEYQSLINDKKREDLIKAHEKWLAEKNYFFSSEFIDAIKPIRDKIEEQTKIIREAENYLSDTKDASVQLMDDDITQEEFTNIVNTRKQKKLEISVAKTTIEKLENDYAVEKKKLRQSFIDSQNAK